MAVRFRVLKQVEIIAHRHMIGVGRRERELFASMSPRVDEGGIVGRPRGIEPGSRRAKAGRVPLVRVSADEPSPEPEPALR